MMEQLEMSPSRANVEENPEDAPQAGLPPVDGGRDAWLVLAACCILEALVWGR